MDKELIKEIKFQGFMLKAILKKIYNLSDYQYTKAMKKFIEQSEEETLSYLEGVKKREDFKEWYEKIRSEDND